MPGLIHEIPLTQGLVARVSREDYADLSRFKWCALRDHDTRNYYAVRHVRIGLKWFTEYMHRRVMQAKKGDQCDHKDMNGLHNYRSNLRLATKQQNMCNRGKTRRNTSGFKGVYWNKLHRKCQAEITVRGQKIYLGLFADPIQAAQVYDVAALRYHGEFACLNFPLTLKKAM